jgi:hypothetical protein
MSIIGTQSPWRLGVRTATPPGEAILGIRALAYRAEGQPGALPPVAGLAMKAAGIIGARPAWDAASGQMRFHDLPPGPRRILVTDPERRFLPAAVMVEVPDRYPPRPTAGGPPVPVPSHPVRRTVLLRPAPGRAIPTGMTAVIGTLRDATGRGIALARLAASTDAGLMRVVTWTDEAGGFALLLPDSEAGIPPATCALAVHAPAASLAAALAVDPLGALPADLDQLDPDGPHSPFEPRPVAILAPDGTVAAGPAGALPLRPGRTVRWDLLAR